MDSETNKLKDEDSTPAWQDRPREEPSMRVQEIRWLPRGLGDSSQAVVDSFAFEPSEGPQAHYEEMISPPQPAAEEEAAPACVPPVISFIVSDPAAPFTIGQVVTLSVIASGSGIPPIPGVMTYQWVINGVPRSTDAEFTFTIDPSDVNMDGFMPVEVTLTNDCGTDSDSGFFPVS